MKISNTISQAIIAAAVGMLQPFVPDLTPTRLIAALKAFDEGQSAIEPHGKLVRPYTVAETMELLNVSKPTIYRMFKDGTLTQLKIREGITRIPAEDIERLLSTNNINKEK